MPARASSGWSSKAVRLCRIQRLLTHSMSPGRSMNSMRRSGAQASCRGHRGLATARLSGEYPPCRARLRSRCGDSGKAARRHGARAQAVASSGIRRAALRPAIDVKWLHEHLDRSGIRQCELGGRGITAHKLAQASRLGGLHAQQPDIIDNVILERSIGVKRALVVGDREPRPLAHRLARVAHVVEPHSGDVLRDRLAQDLPDGPVETRAGFRAVGCSSDDRCTIAKPGPFSSVIGHRAKSRDHEKPVTCGESRVDKGHRLARELRARSSIARRYPREAESAMTTPIRHPLIATFVRSWSRNPPLKATASC